MDFINKYLRTPTATSSTPSNQPATNINNDFNYKNPDNNPISDDSLKDYIPENLVVSFTNLKNAINGKKTILENYKGLYDKLVSINSLLDTYINQHTKIENKIDKLEEKKDELEDKQPDSPDIEDLQKQIEKLKLEKQENDAKMNAIIELLKQASDYINDMYPKDKTDITRIQNLIDQMNGKLSGVSDSSDPRFSQIYGDKNRSSSFSGTNPMGKRIDDDDDEQKGGYRYSSSQMRRKSTKRRSSSSGSSGSSRRRRNKNNTKKMMLGGKRKTRKSCKSTKRNKKQKK